MPETNTFIHYVSLEKSGSVSGEQKNLSFQLGFLSVLQLEIQLNAEKHELCLSLSIYEVVISVYIT